MWGLKPPGNAADPRGALLAAWLEKWSDASAEVELSFGEPWPLDGAASWVAAGLLTPGSERTRAFVAALADGELEPSRDQLLEAYAWGRRCATELLWMEDAIAVQRELHRRYAATWSAIGLALSLHRGAPPGGSDAADAVLAAQIERGADLPDLWSQRGLLAAGRGDERRARDHLGRALGLGSADAALMLARMDLARGRMGGARAGFRALLMEDEPHAWALRGWGIALLTANSPE